MCKTSFAHFWRGGGPPLPGFCAKLVSHTFEEGGGSIKVVSRKLPVVQVFDTTRLVVQQVLDTRVPVVTFHNGRTLPAQAPELYHLSRQYAIYQAMNTSPTSSICSLRTISTPVSWQRAVSCCCRKSRDWQWRPSSNPPVCRESGRRGRQGVS